MTEAFFIYKLHRALILKKIEILEPHIADSFIIKGPKPDIVIGRNDKELFLNWIDNKRDCSLYWFRDTFLMYVVGNEIKRGLRVEYYCHGEIWKLFDLHLNFTNGQINALYINILYSYMDGF